VDNAQAEAIYCGQVHVLDLDRIHPGVAGPDDQIPINGSISHRWSYSIWSATGMWRTLTARRSRQVAQDPGDLPGRPQGPWPAVIAAQAVVHQPDQLGDAAPGQNGSRYPRVVACQAATGWRCAQAVCSS
jgi:hypothetical protein